MELASNKMEQVQYDGIVSYLRTGSFPSSMTKNEKDSLRRKAKNFLESMFIVHVGNLMMAAK